jgi:hypothetical protein
MARFMAGWVQRAAVVALAGALAGAGSFLAAFAIHPNLTFEMDRDLPRLVSGIYSPELSGDVTFAWTTGRARVNMTGADRRVEWRCAIRFRGGRERPEDQPDVALIVDAVTLASKTATNDYQTLEAFVPPRPGASGLTLAVTSSQTFRPGPSDPRDLGVQLDWLTCEPARAFAWPPTDAVVDAAVATAIFGAGLALVGLPLIPAITATLVISALAAVPLAAGPAPYSPYEGTVVWVAFWTALAIVVLAGAMRLVRGQPPGSAARCVIAFSAGVLYLKLVVLLHPLKTIIDGLYHAHRLEWVMAGRYYFTQTMPGGVEFPYAIALYVFAVPWTSLTRDHIALLRIIVCAADVVAAGLLYWVVVRSWKDHLAAALAVVLSHALPVSYWVQGNANLTNAFGQSAALVTMSAAIVWRFDKQRWLRIGALIVLASIAFLSHVSTLALLFGTLLATAGLYGWRGGVALRAPAWSLTLAAVIALGVSVALYYGHFVDAYRTVERARVETPSAPLEHPAETGGASAGARTVPQGVVATSLVDRVTGGLGLSADAIGWPVIVLGLVGVWRLLAERPAGSLVLALLGWFAAWLAFLAFGIVAPGGVGHERQAFEFIARAVHASSPAAAIAAAYGGAWMWRTGMVGRLAATAALIWAAASAVHLWLNWLQ